LVKVVAEDTNLAACDVMVNMAIPERLDSDRLRHPVHGERVNLCTEIDQFHASVMLWVVVFGGWPWSLLNY
jgi:hypothetical protein